MEVFLLIMKILINPVEAQKNSLNKQHLDSSGVAEDIFAADW